MRQLWGELHAPGITNATKATKGVGRAQGELMTIAASANGEAIRTTLRTDNEGNTQATIEVIPWHGKNANRYANATRVIWDGRLGINN
jgi:hypothetical protein